MNLGKVISISTKNNGLLRVVRRIHEFGMSKSILYKFDTHWVTLNHYERLIK